MEPVDALSRIAYLLERSGAETYKVRAFRRAVRSIEGFSRDELDALATSGRLTSLPDVGESTATVIKEALSGGVPRYLAELGEPAPLTYSPEAEALRARLQGDCHSHSNWSDGQNPIEEMAAAAMALGHRYLVLTDHSPRLTVAHGLNPQRLREQLELVGALNEVLAPFRILTGIEVDILEDGSLDQEESLLAELDVVVASIHSKLAMEERAMTRRMVRAVESPHTDILGHCTGRIITGRGRAQSRFDPEVVFGACAESGTAVEINSRLDRRDPPRELLARALDSGCLVSIDSDAHAPGQLEWLGLGCEQAVEVDTPAERIVNTWAMDDLLSWAASHR